MYWSLKRSHPVIVTWNFTRTRKIRRKIWWESEDCFGEDAVTLIQKQASKCQQRGCPLTTKKPLLPNTQSLLRIVKELPHRLKLFTKPRMRKLSQNGNTSQHMVQCQGQERKWNRTAFVASHRIAFLGELIWNAEVKAPTQGYWVRICL